MSNGVKGLKHTKESKTNMTDTQQVIEIAIRRGWDRIYADIDHLKEVRISENNALFFDGDGRKLRIPVAEIFLAPLFWQALGKEMGWVGDGLCPYRRNHESPCDYCDNTWKDNWHSFIETIASGGTIEQWSESILKGKK